MFSSLVGDISEADASVLCATRDVSTWSESTRAIYESVYGDELPALWAAFVDRYMEYLVRILNRCHRQMHYLIQQII